MAAFVGCSPSWFFHKRNLLDVTATAAAAAAAPPPQVTYREFAYGHMDFTSLAAFSIKDEMRYHVMRALNANS
jgi:hypothetical protein